ncbi:MAG: GNAT family N-acetyltransferase [Sumerlaeia bacterium]
MPSAPEFHILRGNSPDEQSALIDLLGHKGIVWLLHVRDYFKRGACGMLEGLEWRFCCVQVNGVLVSTSCLWESKGVGILAHVFTRPSARGKGFAKDLMAFALQNFDARGGHWLQLNVEPNSFQQSFYSKFNFEKHPQQPGSMIRLRTEVLIQPAQYSGDVQASPMKANSIRPFCWGDFPHWNKFFLELQHKEAFHNGFQVETPCSLEFPLIEAHFGNAEFTGCALMNHAKEQIIQAIATRITRNGECWVDVHQNPNATATPVPVELIDCVLQGVSGQIYWRAAGNLGVLAAEKGFTYCEAKRCWIRAV